MKMKDQIEIKRKIKPKIWIRSIGLSFFRDKKRREEKRRGKEEEEEEEEKKKRREEEREEISGMEF